MEVPKETAEIFSLLSKGHFICSVSRQHRKLYEVLSDEDNFNSLRRYFSHINFRLEQGNGFFYFSRGLSEGEIPSDLEERIARFNKYVDMLAFFSSLSEKFSAGVKFRPSKIAEECIHNPVLQSKLQSIRAIATLDTLSEKIRELAEELRRESFVEKLQDSEENYLVLDAYHYLEQLVCAINPKDDDEQANP